MIEMDDVLRATADAVSEFGDTVLAMEVQTKPLEHDFTAIDKLMNHVSIALVSDSVALQLAVCAPGNSCEALSRALLGMEEGEDIGSEDVADGIGELTNIIAGGLKSRLDKAYPALKLGLPVWNSQVPEPCQKSTDVGCVPASIGDHPVTLTVMREARSS
jgi:hypothetical protein